MPLLKKKHSTPSPQVATVPPLSPGMPATEDFYQHLRREIRQAAQSVIEAVLQEELAQFLAVGWGESSPDRKGYRNGFYLRDLATTAGRIEDLNVPREREAHGMRNEITANKRCFVNRPRKQIQLYRLLADRFVEILPHRRKSTFNKAWSQAVSFDTYSSLRIPWEPEPIRTTEFAPALPPAKEHTAPASGYAAASVALPFKQGRFSGRDFALQPDGTLRCPAGQALCATEERREADGSLRLVYAARISHCRDCQFREQCQWHGRTTTKPRRVSVVLHPLQIGSAPLFWKDWSRRQHRRACMQLLRHQRVDVHLEPPSQPDPATSPPVLSRAQRAHYRLSWEERLACNVCASTTGRSTITLFGVPEAFAASLGLLTA